MLKCIAGAQVSGWVNRLPAQHCLSISWRAAGTAIHRDALVYNPALIAVQSLSRLKQCQKVDGQERAPPCTPHHPFLPMYPFLQGADKDRHIAHSHWFQLMLSPSLPFLRFCSALGFR